MATPLEDMGLGSIGNLSLGGFDYWITLGVNIILSTIISGIALVIVVKMLSRKYEYVESGNAFIMALVVNIINFFGVAGVLGLFLPLPFVGLFLPLIIWIVLAKFFFSEMSFSHVLALAFIGYVLSLFAIPPITETIKGFIPIN